MRNGTFKRGSFASTMSGIKLACNHASEKYWNAILYAMKHSVKKSMKVVDYRCDFKAEYFSDIFHHLPIGLQEIHVRACPHERVAIEALLDWFENTSTNLKKSIIYLTCIGERLARILARHDCRIEVICLDFTYLVGISIHGWNAWRKINR